jgi:hypothetical protein
MAGAAALSVTLSLLIGFVLTVHREAERRMNGDRLEPARAARIAFLHGLLDSLEFHSRMCGRRRRSISRSGEFQRDARRLD